MTGESILPPGWCDAVVGDVANYVRGVSYDKTQAHKTSSSGRVTVLRANNLSEGQFDFADLVFVDKIAVSLEQHIRENDIVFAMSSGSKRHVGKSVLATRDMDAAFGAFCGLLRPRAEITAAFLAWQFQGRDYRRHIENVAMGTNINNLKSSELLGFPITLAPVREQHRIVAKIEELFSELDKAVESLLLARAQLKTYRQALLKAAFEGRLTADWRAANPGKIEPPETLLARIRAERQSRGGELDRRALRPLPEGWVWATVQEAGDVQLGRQRAPQHHTGEHIRPYLRVANVHEDALDLRDVKEMNFTPKEFETFALRDGDVLLNEGQAPELLGRPAIYRNQIPGCCFQKTLLRFRPRLSVNSEFALIVFRHYMRSGRFKKESRITTNIGHLTQVRFVVMEFPIPTRAEQDEIVRRFRELEAIGLEAEIDNGLARIDALRQSILKRAFSGQLVPQDPTDEPAAALLARLRDEAPPARSRRRKTA